MHRNLCVCTSPHGYNCFGHPTPDTGTKNTSLLNFFVCSVYLFSIFPIIDLCKTVTCEFFAFFMCKMKNKSKGFVCSRFTSIYQSFFFCFVFCQSRSRRFWLPRKKTNAGYVFHVSNDVNWLRSCQWSRILFLNLSVTMSLRLSSFVCLSACLPPFWLLVFVILGIKVRRWLHL